MPTINFHLWIKQVSGPDQREAFQGGLPVEWWQGEQPARTKAFNKCIAITAGTCLGAATSSAVAVAVAVAQFLSCSVAPLSQSQSQMAQLANNSIAILASQFSRAAYRQLPLPLCGCKFWSCSCWRCICSYSFSICPNWATRPKSLNASHVIFLGRSGMEWSLWD